MEPAVVLGIPIDRMTYGGLLDQFDDWISEHPRQVHQVCTVNPEFIVDAQTNPLFRNALLDADLRVTDGAGVAWAANSQGRPVPERITGSDGIYRICERAAEAGWLVFFLGAGPGVAARAAAAMQAQYPGLRVAGAYAGEPWAEDWPNIRDRLQAARPDVLLVAFGHPKQDVWISTHREDLPAAVAMGVGGALDFAAGVSRRAPPWMRRVGIEWLFRLQQEPWRWRRMLKLPRFVAMVLRERWI
jgi:N-acetylglucosaminyldiphosphoundecaprenol N-acetyl-beta-D-mannosaminyltransferase